MQQYDVAAYIWPSYHNDPRSRIFWPEGIGEWQSVRSNEPKFPGHLQPRRPLWGYVNEADPNVMRMQIDAAADHGVNTFIYDWYWYDRRPFLESCLNDGFLGAPNNARMKFFLMWANHDAATVWDKRIAHEGDEIVWLGSVDRKEFEIVAHRLIDRYFRLPNYYRIGGKPVFMIYDLGSLLRGLGGVRETREALDWFREACAREGLGGLHLMSTIWSERAFSTGVDGGNVRTTRDITGALGFDSMSHYQFVHFTDIDREYDDILPDVAREWARIDAEYSIPYFPHISVGWDNNPRFTTMRPGIVRGNTPEAIERGLRMAREYADAHPNQPPLITVNSWNEWTETSYLQPDDLYGYGYLEAIRRVFAR